MTAAQVSEPRNDDRFEKRMDNIESRISAAIDKSRSDFLKAIGAMIAGWTLINVLAIVGGTLVVAKILGRVDEFKTEKSGDSQTSKLVIHRGPVLDGAGHVDADDRGRLGDCSDAVSSGSFAPRGQGSR